MTTSEAKRRMQKQWSFESAEQMQERRLRYEAVEAERKATLKKLQAEFAAQSTHTAPASVTTRSANPDRIRFSHDIPTARDYMIDMDFADRERIHG